MFSRLIIVDYEKNTYEYLEGTQRGLPSHGKYTDLYAYMLSHYLGEADVVQPADLISQESVQKNLLGDKPYLRYEYRINWDGEHWENASILCLKRKGNIPVSVLFAIQDVTDLKKWEQKTRQALTDAYQAAEDANRAKSQFLSRMSHDIRTPMNAIIGMTSIALMHLEDPVRVKDCLNKITTSSRHLLELINEVLDMSKIESGKITLSEEPFVLSAMIDEIVSIVSIQTDVKKQNFEIHCFDVTHENVIGDPLRLRQMLVNIIANASKFTPEEGHISFCLTEKPSRIAGSACYEFVIEDDGIGMEKEFISQIFAPFTRSRNSRQKNIEGTGLGLSIASNIAQMMNGSIDVKSQLNQGTAFTVQIYLKLAEGREKLPNAVLQEDTVSLNRLAKTSYDGIRVLLVEDNELNTEIACELLSSAGIQVETAADGQKAVDTVKSHPAYYYSLIFMDIQMPVKNGYETAREIRSIGREDLKQIPIIAMSADAFTDDVKRALDAGMNDHVAKPIERSKNLYLL